MQLNQQLELYGTLYQAIFKHGIEVLGFLLILQLLTMLPQVQLLVITNVILELDIIGIELVA
ncbi:TPA: hypothetical protein DEG21_03075 [Patescibacteria group bacterium]|nr:hypothetical protein [Candidatus Gracilibacteria bacterium]HBY74847.1 hypothetical protein [Candidatus Gracilibacteria bacterium]